MEGEHFSSFARSYLTKRPRLMPRQDLQQYPLTTAAAAASSLAPSDSAAMESETVNRVQRMLIEPTDEELLCWQERQISKCIVDNTVNRVVESYLTFFEDENHDDLVAADVFPDIIDPYAFPANDRFEESAILWAIDEHGLQQHNQHVDNDRSETVSVSSSPQPDRSLVPSEQSLHCETSTDETGGEQEKGSTNMPIKINRDSGSKSSSSSSSRESITESLKATTSQAIHPLANESTVDSFTTVTTSNNDDDDARDGIDAKNHPNETNEHFDFMEAAVAVAIQKKGLVPYSIQMSPNR